MSKLLLYDLTDVALFQALGINIFFIDFLRVVEVHGVAMEGLVGITRPQAQKFIAADSNDVAQGRD